MFGWFTSQQHLLFSLKLLWSWSNRSKYFKIHKLLPPFLIHISSALFILYMCYSCSHHSTFLFLSILTQFTPFPITCYLHHSSSATLYEHASCPVIVMLRGSWHYRWIFSLSLEFLKCIIPAPSILSSHWAFSHYSIFRTHHSCSFSQNTFLLPPPCNAPQTSVYHIHAYSIPGFLNVHNSFAFFIPAFIN